MSTTLFQVKEHFISTQYIREYPAATAGHQEYALRLCVKQYTPLLSPSSTQRPITIIGAHANGFPKELYEPLWDELLNAFKFSNFTIRSIWMADVAHQGQSGVLNEENLGYDPSWMDHSRDMLHMINHFRDEMPRPLIGIGHSMGGCQLAILSLIHPRLLSALVLVDPVIMMGRSMAPPGQKMEVARASTFRKDLWSSKEAAAATFKKSSFFQAWDSRVLDRWLRYGLRPLPTKLYPDMSREGCLDNPVTLSTTKHQEVWTFLRPNFAGEDGDGLPIYNRSTHIDLDREAGGTYPFYRPEPMWTFVNLPHIRPPVFYVFGELSNISPLSAQKHKLEATGIGLGGSGGSPGGRVKSVTFRGVGHLVPMEAPSKTAHVIHDWLEPELKGWSADEEAFEQLRRQKGPQANIVVSNEWTEHMGGDPRKQKAKI